MTRFFASVPELKPDTVDIIRQWDGKMWVLISDWYFEFENDFCHIAGTVHKGFETDGGSVPDRQQDVISPLGKYLPIFLLHDVLYSIHGDGILSRADCDNILGNGFDVIGTDSIAENVIENLAELLVEAFAFKAWNEKTPESIELARRFIDIEILRK